MPSIYIYISKAAPDIITPGLSSYKDVQAFYLCSQSYQRQLVSHTTFIDYLITFCFMCMCGCLRERTCTTCMCAGDLRSEGSRGLPSTGVTDAQKPSNVLEIELRFSGRAVELLTTELHVQLHSQALFKKVSTEDNRRP